MKTLCLMRHAKTDEENLYDSDLARKLAPSGCHDAKIMAQAMQDMLFKPQIIITSPAKRTQETSHYVANLHDMPDGAIQIVDSIYEASVEELLKIIQQINNEYDSVLLVGHNPGLTLLTNYFNAQAVFELPTCGTVCVQFDTDNWQDILNVKVDFLFIDNPGKHAYDTSD